MNYFEHVNESFERLYKNVATESLKRNTNKRRPLKEASDDFIKIGKMTLPKNMADYDGMTYDQVTRKAQQQYDQDLASEKAEKEAKIKAEKEAKLKAELEAKAKPLLDKINKELANTKEDRIEVLFSNLVPDYGNCETLAGELVRAMMKILYRDYNDGDVFYDGYGLETCGAPAMFLYRKLDELGNPEVIDKLYDIAHNGLEETKYTNAINAIADNLVDFILSHPELLATPNTEDMYDEDIGDLADWVPMWDYDFDISGYLEEYVEQGSLSYYDIYYALEEFVNNELDSSYRPHRINQWARDAFSVEVSPNEYSQLDREYPRFLDQWLDDLESEFGPPGESYEDEDEEDYEDEDEE